jgi:succinate dehydrogenase / fumarate reductase cytochrome b subunit
LTLHCKNANQIGVFRGISRSRLAFWDPERQGTTFMASHPRPTAPHLQIYRPQITSVLSILHRIAGVWLAVGVVALVYWLIAAATGAEAFDRAQGLAGSIIGRTLLLLWTGAFFYHLLNGVRHLCWDAGWGFELTTTYRTGWAVLIGAVILTLAAWTLGYWARGAI